MDMVAELAAFMEEQIFFSHHTKQASGIFGIPYTEVFGAWEIELNFFFVPPGPTPTM